MPKRSKVFSIIISILLSLCILSIAFLFLAVYYFDQVVISRETYEVSVAGVPITQKNQDDILGDGTVFFDPEHSTLVFANADIETDQSLIISTIDLGICLIGENKFKSTTNNNNVFISVADYYNTKDLYIYGDGSLTIEYLNPCTDSAVLQCADLTVLSDITIATPECTNFGTGIVCDSSFKLSNGATVTVNGSPAKSLVAFRVRGNMFLDTDTAINVTVDKGSTEGAKGITINGDLIIGTGASVNVSMAEDTAKTVECIRVNGLIDIAAGASMTANTAKSYAVACYGAIKLCDDAVISAATKDGDADIICYGAVVNYGAAVNGEIEALGQLYDKSEE